MPNQFSIEKQLNCPQCGYSLALYFKHTKLDLIKKMGA